MRICFLMNGNLDKLYPNSPSYYIFRHSTTKCCYNHGEVQYFLREGMKWRFRSSGS